VARDERLNDNSPRFSQTDICAGAGLAIGIYDGTNMRLPKKRNDPLRAYLAIDPSGAVKVVVARAENGPGGRDIDSMLVAEELETDWSRFRSNRRADRSMAIWCGGSMSIGVLEPLRTAGAAAREMLLPCAKEWNVDDPAMRKGSIS
jgi:CO/xanthine dehydrogenase Mo-binding subunit